MKTTYTIVITVLSIVAAILSPDQIREYVMFGLLVMMISITRWESDKILKALKANTKNESEVLNIPRVSGQSEQLGCPKCGSDIIGDGTKSWCKSGKCDFIEAD